MNGFMQSSGSLPVQPHMEAKVYRLTAQLETTQQDWLTEPILGGVGRKGKKVHCSTEGGMPFLTPFSCLQKGAVCNFLNLILC
jgi:hypothetical protein